MAGQRVVRDWDTLVPQIVSDLDRGKRLTTIAKSLGVSTERVRQVLKKYGHTIPAQRPLPLGKRPPKAVLIAREHAIIKDRTENGLSLEEIGAKHQITRERVRQILVGAGYLDHTDQARTGREERTAQQEQELHEELVGLLTATPALTRAELAAHTGAHPDDVTRLLGTSIWMLSEDQTARAAYDDDEMLACVSRAARDMDVTEISARMYDHWRSSRRGRGLPSSQSIIRRFGAWSTAVEQSGLDAIAPNRGNYRRVTWNEATSAVASFIVASRKADALTRATAADYDAYARAMGITPSIAGLRLYWSWREVRVGAVQKIIDRMAKQKASDMAAVAKPKGNTRTI